MMILIEMINDYFDRDDHDLHLFVNLLYCSPEIAWELTSMIMIEMINDPDDFDRDDHDIFSESFISSHAALLNTVPLTFNLADKNII